MAMACVQATLDIREPLAQPHLALYTPFDLANSVDTRVVMAQGKRLSYLSSRQSMLHVISLQRHMAGRRSLTLWSSTVRQHLRFPGIGRRHSANPL